MGRLRRWDQQRHGSHPAPPKLVRQPSHSRSVHRPPQAVRGQGRRPTSNRRRRPGHCRRRVRRTHRQRRGRTAATAATRRWGRRRRRGRRRRPHGPGRRCRRRWRRPSTTPTAATTAAAAATGSTTRRIAPAATGSTTRRIAAAATWWRRGEATGPTASASRRTPRPRPSSNSLS